MAVQMLTANSAERLQSAALPRRRAPLEAASRVEIRHRFTRRILHVIYANTLNEAMLAGANLIEADLAGGSLCSANLRGASLVGANLRGANLMGASLQGADLRDACLVGAQLAGARYDARTLWPVGLNPQVAGAQLVEHRKRTCLG